MKPQETLREYLDQVGPDLGGASASFEKLTSMTERALYSPWGLSQEEQGGLLRHLVDSGEMSKYGLQWAVTRLSQDVVDYDRASDLERLGGQVIELAQNEWEVLAKAA